MVTLIRRVKMRSIESRRLHTNERLGCTRRFSALCEDTVLLGILACEEVLDDSGQIVGGRGDGYRYYHAILRGHAIRPLLLCGGAQNRSAVTPASQQKACKFCERSPRSPCGKPPGRARSVAA